jgi:hypothetical protein
MTGIPIRGTAKGSAGAAFTIAKRRGAQRLDFLLPYLTELYAFAPKYGLDSDVLVGQADLETGAFTSGFYVNDGNVAGFGVPSKGPPQGLKYTATGAARAQVIHWCAYLGVDVSEADQKLDPRWNAVFEASLEDTVSTTADMGNGTWAEDPDYPRLLIERYTAYWGEYTDASSVPTPSKETPVSTTLTYGRVPFPGFVDRKAATANKPEGIGWDNLGRRTPMFVVLHRMLGTLNSTDSYFPQASTQALTDFGLGTSNVDGQASDGKIIQWNDPRGYRAGWSSGPVSAPYGDALKWIQWSGNKWGVSICNVCGVSIEHSGQYNDAVSDFAFGEDAKFLAYWFDQFKIAWDKAPIHPVTGISAVTWHQEWTIGTGKICPGPWLMENTDRLIAAAAAIMKTYQLGGGDVVTPPGVSPVVTPPAPQYAKPQAIPELVNFSVKDADTANATVDTSIGTATWVNDTVKAIRDTKRYQKVDLKDEVGPVLKKDDTAHVLFLIQCKDGTEVYYSDWYTIFKAADFKRVKD